VRALLVILLAACVSCASAEPAADPSTGSPPSQVTGLITETSYEGEQMTSFVVESREGPVEILIDPERDYGFNLQHLEQHRSQELPVQVPVESKDGGLYAVDVLDA
jgi:hypothetical protein